MVKRCFNVPASVTWECADDSGPVGDALAARIILPVCDLIPLLVDFPATADAIIAWHDGAGTQAHRRPATEPYQMLFYTGMFDMSCGFAGTDRMLRSMRWRGQDKWAHAVRGVWYTEGDVGARGEPARLTQGCVKHVENLTQIEIPQAGHMVPLDQPRIARNMIYRFIWGTGFPSYDPLAR